jgi:hypothetical protein
VDLVLRVMLGSDPRRPSSSSVLRPFHSVCSEGREAALRTISHLLLYKAAKRGMPPEQQLRVLAAADQAMSLTIRGSQMDGLVACLVQQLEQQQQAQEEEEGFTDRLLQDGMLRLSFGSSAAAPDITPPPVPTNSSGSSGSGCGSSSYHTQVLTATCGSATRSSSTSSITTTGAPSSHPKMAGAKLHAPVLNHIMVTGSVSTASLEQLLDLLPGTQHLQEVLLCNRGNGPVFEDFLKLLEGLTGAPGFPERVQHRAGAHAQQRQSRSTSGGGGSGGGGSQDSRGPAPAGIRSSWRSSCCSLAVVLTPRGTERPAAPRISIQRLRPLLGRLQQLQNLFLIGVSVGQLRLYVDALRPLRLLHIEGMGSCGPAVLACVAGLTNLRHLGINGSASSLTTWPEAFTDLVHLFSLDLRQNLPTEDVLEGVCSMTRLHRLNLMCTAGFTTLPPSISRLQKLNCLMLYKSDVGTLPGCMTALTGLRMLSWSQDAATEPLPLEVVWQLTRLHYLWIKDHHMASLPEAISGLSNLQMLAVGGGHLGCPAQWCQRSCQRKISGPGCAPAAGAARSPDRPHPPDRSDCAQCGAPGADAGCASLSGGTQGTGLQPEAGT